MIKFSLLEIKFRDNIETSMKFGFFEWFTAIGICLIAFLEIFLKYV